jgi:hypothetical protein
MKYTSKNVGRCLTEYKLTNYDDVVKECVLFFSVTQFRNVTGFSLQRIEELNIRIVDKPCCGSGMVSYGVKSDKSIIKLMEIIDSSD